MFGTIWNDFVSFRINYLYNDLNKLLLNLNVSRTNIKWFYKYFKFQRNQFIYLPTNNGYDCALYSNNFKEYKEITDYFSVNNNGNNGDAILRYFLIYNAIFTLINKCYKKDTHNNNVFGFDNIIYENKDKILNNKNINELIVSLLMNFMLDQFCTTNIFTFNKENKNKINDCRNEYINNMNKNKNNNNNSNDNDNLVYKEWNDTPFQYTGSFALNKDKDKIDAKMKKYYLANNDIILNKCKAVLFNNNLTKFKQFLNESIKDINLNNIENYVNVDHNDQNQGQFNGLSCFIVNRMSLIVFNDLSYFDRNELGNVKHPSLLSMYKFLWNFSVYCHCYPFQSAEYEKFYLLQYFYFKNTMYKNVFNNKNATMAMTTPNAPQEPLLHNFNYFNYESLMEGTILHHACFSRCNQYCDLLLKDNFDPFKYNIFSKKGRLTPFDICKQLNYSFGLTLMQPQVL